MTFQLTENVKLLGINFCIKQKNAKDNWNKIIQKIKSIIEIHQDRKITIYGKIQIIHTLLVPQIIMHVAKILSPPRKIINHLNSLLFKFLWHPNWIENIKSKKTNLNVQTRRTENDKYRCKTKDM